MTQEEFQIAVLARFDRLEARLDVMITSFNGRMDAADHRLDMLWLRLDSVDGQLGHIDKRLAILETLHRHHMADIDRRLGKLEQAGTNNG